MRDLLISAGIAFVIFAFGTRTCHTIDDDVISLLTIIKQE